MTNLMDEYMYWWKRAQVERWTQGQPSDETNRMLEECETALFITERNNNQVKNRGCKE